MRVVGMEVRLGDIEVAVRLVWWYSNGHTRQGVVTGRGAVRSRNKLIEEQYYRVQPSFPSASICRLSSLPPVFLGLQNTIAATLTEKGVSSSPQQHVASILALAVTLLQSI